MSRSRLWIPLLLAVLVPAAGHAQSLGDAAAKETARRKEREAKEKEKAPVYTNDNLEHGQKPQPSPTPANAPASPPRKMVNPNDLSSQEKSWRQRAEAARAAVKAAEGKVTSLEAQSQLLLTRRIASTDTNEILRLQAEQKVIIDQIGPAKEEVEAAKKALQDFEDSARAAAIPQGWIEPDRP